ncbi:MAG: methyltransferase domain-containing protein, partial [Steroidobacteraceae bacterium]
MDMMAYLACPRCHASLTRAEGSLSCSACDRSYPLSGDVPQLGQVESDAGANGADRREYWDRGWQARDVGDHAYLHELTSPAQWRTYIRQQMAAAPGQFYPEAGAATVRDRVMLEIGCGAGISSATFGYLGAHYIGIDHSVHAARHSLAHLRGIGGEGFTAQGNAEALPLRDGCIEFVYSNGVLHHTPKFATAMDEVYRVLRPGGTALIALYSTYSLQFGAVRLQGILKGRLSRASMQRWMGQATEGAWRTEDRVNPWTETFSVGRLRRFMRRYAVHDLGFRKYGSPIAAIPRIGAGLIRLGAVRHIDAALEPLLGGMVIMRFTKAGSGAAGRPAAAAGAE